MKSNETPAWAKTTSFDFAAAVSVLGIAVNVDKAVDKISGRGWTTLLLGLESVPYEAIGAKAQEGDSAPCHKTQTVVGLLRNGQLQKADPHHPALDVLRACKARESLLNWIKTGQGYHLEAVAGTARYQLVKGENPPSLSQLAPGFMTRDLKLAASLCVLGCPLIRIGGTEGSTEFYFTVKGYGMPAPVTGDLAQFYRSGRLAEMEPEHPLLWCMQGLKNRDAIADLVHRKSPLVLIRAPGTGRAALVSQNAQGRVMDHVRKHLRIVA